MLTGAYTIMDWSFNEFYPDRRATAFALAKVIRQEVEALSLQAAESFKSTSPRSPCAPKNCPSPSEAMEFTTKGQDAYFITHACYGEFENIYPGMLDLAVDNFDLEMSNRDLDLLELFRRHPFTKDISFGVVDVALPHERQRRGRARKSRAGSDHSPQRAGVGGPRLRVKNSTVEEAVEKLRSCVTAAKSFRNASATEKNRDRRPASS